VFACHRLFAVREHFNKGTELLLLLLLITIAIIITITIIVPSPRIRSGLPVMGVTKQDLSRALFIYGLFNNAVSGSD
jgi:hypothetical protein